MSDSFLIECAYVKYITTVQVGTVRMEKGQLLRFVDKHWRKEYHICIHKLRKVQMKMENIAYYNGKISSIEEMMIPMNERSSYFGDGVYDAMFTVDHVPLQLDDHLRRFYRSAKKIDIEIPMAFEELRAMVLDFCQKVDDPSQMVYVQATRGVGMRGHAYRFAGDMPSLWVFVKPDFLDPMDRDYSCITMEDTRFFHCDIKTINLLPSVIYTQRAEEAGCDETILHRGERVTECAHSNVHILKDGVLHTAPCDNLILPGITRAHRIAQCKEMGIPVVEEPFTVEEMMAADEVFFTSASALCCRVTTIDGKPVGGRDEATIRRIQKAAWDEALYEVAAIRKELGL